MSLLPIRIVIASLPVLGIGTTVFAQGAAKRPPNVVFFFADDQRPDTIGALGNGAIRTPNLDVLANRGMVFTNAYCMGATLGAVCNPSRHQMLSGMALYHYKLRRPTHEGTFGDVFTKAGYVTYQRTKNGNTAKKYHKGFTHRGYLKDRRVRTGGHHGKAAADHAITFLRDAWDRKKPVFMYVGFAGPHDPRVAAPKWMSRYKRADIPLPPNFKPFHSLDNGDLFVRDERLAKWPRTPEEVRKHLHDYYACITSLDHHIGRVIQALKDLGQYDNTIFIFSADHGLAIGSHGLFGKQNLYEHSMGAPLIFAGPGIPKGKTDAFAYLFDIFPTTAALAGLSYPKDLDGESLVPVIRGRKKAVRDTVLLAYKDVQRAVRRGPWKLHRFPKINRSLLYNLDDDPHEVKNLAADPAHAGRVKEMYALLQAEQDKYSDPVALTVANPTRAVLDAAFFANPPKKQRRRNRKKK